MRTIKIKFVDFWPDLIPENNIITNILSEKYKIELSEKPDYIFYSVFGHDHLKYKGIRIFFTGESVFPDFNICDYAMGYDYITIGDRYCRLPLYYWQLNDNLYEASLKNRCVDKQIFKNKKFCNFVYSNKGANSFRTDLFYNLCKYKHVESGGKYLNNIGRCVADKIEYCKQFKFTIACENSVYNGYVTEKIIHAFISGGIPIYWGNPLIHLDMNPKSFINCSEYNSIQEVVNRVKEIDQNDSLYLDMMREPILKMSLEEKKNELKGFLYNIFEQQLEAAFRRNLSFAGERYERKQYYLKNIENMVPKNIIKILLK